MKLTIDVEISWLNNMNTFKKFFEIWSKVKPILDPTFFGMTKLKLTSRLTTNPFSLNYWCSLSVHFKIQV
jgi:hypothetical protein